MRDWSLARAAVPAAYVGAVMGDGKVDTARDEVPPGLEAAPTTKKPRGPEPWRGFEIIGDVP
jgi:hypothetical protein